MLLYLKRNYAEAIAEYDPDKKACVVKKGSKVSDDISYTEKFKGANTIEKYRAKYVKDGVVLEDAPFKSSSTAANFVTGRSTNGLTAWKDENGVSLKALLQK